MVSRFERKEYDLQRLVSGKPDIFAGYLLPLLLKCARKHATIFLEFFACSDKDIGGRRNEKETVCPLYGCDGP